MLWFRRTGFSTNRYENSESASEIMRHISPSNTESFFSRAAAAMMSTGQCHRYAEYEREPSHCIGDRRNIASGDHTVAFPPRNKNAVAITGASAHGPGKVVVSENKATVAMIPASPHQASTALIRTAAAETPRGTTATRAPIASSNARVCGEKNAHGCDEFISAIHAIKEATVAIPAVMPTRRRTLRMVRVPTPMHTTITSAGHTR